MILVSYDISENKLRTAFSKYLEKYGNRLQYSVFKIENSPRILSNIKSEIENNFSKKFCESDSVYIFTMNDSCRTIKYGHAKHDDEDVIVVC